MTNLLSQRRLRALAVMGIATAAVSASTAIATSASAALPPSCKGIGFNVLHNDSSGGVTLPGGKYTVSSPNLACTTASNYFTTFLNKYNNAIPGWKGKAIAKGWGTYTMNNSTTQFTVKWSKATAPPQLRSCSSSDLALSLGQPNGSAGTTFYPLNFINKSKTSCTLRGYPGVSAVTSSGAQIGSPASRIQSSYATVALTPGARGTAQVGLVDAGNFPPNQCAPANAAALKVLPPNQTKSLSIKLSFLACASTLTNTTRITVIK